MFGGLSDSVVQFTTQAAEYTWERYQVNTTYKWGRYNVVEQEYYKETESNNSNQYCRYLEGSTYATSYGFSTTTGKYTLRSIVEATSSARAGYVQSVPSPSMSGSKLITTTPGTYSQICRMIKSNDAMRWRYMRAEIAGYTDTKGSYIDDVSSTSSSAYPSNGASGSYWYVSKGSETSRGNYIDNVTSSNYTQYPDNGIKDGYWYVRK